MSRSEKRASTQDTQPALLEAELPTTSSVAVLPVSGRYASLEKKHVGWYAVAQVLALGVLLELCTLALYPLLAGPMQAHDPVQQALPGLFPWLTHLNWTTAFPALAHAFVHVPWLDPLAPVPAGSSMSIGSANMIFLLLSLCALIVLVAALVGRHATRGRLSPFAAGMLFFIMIVFTGIIGITLVFAPMGVSALSRDTLLYGLYGRMVTLYHVTNPYVLLPTQGQSAHDVLQTVLHAQTGAPFGPLWLNISILIALIANNSIASLLLGFRVLGLASHLINAILIWCILAKVKPEFRISSTLLYAWNPLILLLGVYQPHLEVVLVFFVLLAVFSFQRNALTLGWIFLLLASMIHPVCLLLLPLFFLVALKESRVLSPVRRVLWWLGMVTMTVLVVVLAYLPYWHGWGITGIATSMRMVFWPDATANSLASALGSLSLRNQPLLTWLAAPHHWAFLAVLVAASIVLLGMWLTSTLDLLLLFCAWIVLVILLLEPVYWPWYALLPLALALPSANRQTVLLAVLVTGGGLLGYYCNLWPVIWMGQGLLTVGLPLVTWGWIMFFSSTWRMAHVQEEEVSKVRARASRTNWPSRPSWPSRWPRR